MKWMTVVLFCFSAFVSNGVAGEFSADLTHREGMNRVSYRVYVKGNKMRRELPEQGFAIIIRGDRGTTGIVWTVVPKEKVFMEEPISVADIDIPELNLTRWDAAGKKYVGKEKLNGYLCDKFEIDFSNKTLEKITVWFSKDLNIALKIEGDKICHEYRDVIEQMLPDSLFEIPRGYSKMDEILGCCP